MPRFTGGCSKAETGAPRKADLSGTGESQRQHHWGLRPLEEFNIVRPQLGFLGDRFIPYAMPGGYVYDFLFCPLGTVIPRWSRRRHERADGPAGQA